MTPVNASKKENEIKFWRNLYPDNLEIKDIKPKFSVGDNIRTSKNPILRGWHEAEFKNIDYEDLN